MNRHILQFLFPVILMAGAATVHAADVRDIAAAPYARITLEQSIDVALSKHPGATPLDADLDGHHDGTTDYDVHVITPDGQVYKVKVDPISGLYLGERAEGRRKQPVPEHKLTLKEAIRIAEHKHKGSKALNADLIEEGGKARFVVETLTPEKKLREIMIDAIDGRVLFDREDQADY